AAMTNLMCRGRKRGLAGVIATQRLAKLAKNVAAEASNLLMGRTFLDIDMIRAADLLGMERRQAEQIRDLERGSFLGLGPAISRRPVSVRIGTTQTHSRGGTHGLLPLPEAEPNDMRSMLFAAMETAPPPSPPPAPPAVAAGELLRRISEGDDRPVRAATPAPEAPEVDAADVEDAVAAALREMLADPDCAFHPE